MIGRAIKLNDSVFTVIGVGPRGFLSLDVADQVDVYVPLMNAAVLQADPKLPACRDCAWLNVMGRLKPGVSPHAAESAMGNTGRGSRERPSRTRAASIGKARTRHAAHPGRRAQGASGAGADLCRGRSDST